jgi:hypothetical protein
VTKNLTQQHTSFDPNKPKRRALNLESNKALMFTSAGGSIFSSTLGEKAKSEELSGRRRT